MSGDRLTIGDEKRDILRRVAREVGTPCYAYLLDAMLARVARVRDAFEGRFELSYAVKANPNHGLLQRLHTEVATLDVSSIGEAELTIAAGCAPGRLSFSGPAKRVVELERAVDLGVGEMICESVWEMEQLDAIAGRAGQIMPVCVRINPARCPARFGVNMAGRASQFGIDEEGVSVALERLHGLQNLEFHGFHIYSATNSLSADAIAENFAIFIDLFTRFVDVAPNPPATLIFGAGFGIPYVADATPLDLAKLAALINPAIDEMKRVPRLADARCILEMGRYLVGPEGYLLTTVIGEKTSRGTEIRMCDAGFNAHLAAFGMMGTVIRRNWPMWNLEGDEKGPAGPYMLTGPLCTAIDVLATDITLPVTGRGDVLAVGSSGAYGRSASPTGFISHPEPKEVLVVGMGADAELVDVSSQPVATRGASS